MGVMNILSKGCNGQAASANALAFGFPPIDVVLTSIRTDHSRV